MLFLSVVVACNKPFLVSQSKQNKFTNDIVWLYAFQQLFSRPRLKLKNCRFSANFLNVQRIDTRLVILQISKMFSNFLLKH